MFLTAIILSCVIRILYDDWHLFTSISFFHSRIFIKILFQCITEYLGIPKLNDRITDPYVLASLLMAYFDLYARMYICSKELYALFV